LQSTRIIIITKTEWKERQDTKINKQMGCGDPRSPEICIMAICNEVLPETSSIGIEKKQSSTVGLSKVEIRKHKPNRKQM